MDKKESAFISAVLYLSDYANNAEKFIKNLLETLKSYFENYEVIIVDDCCAKHGKLIKEILPSIDESTITVVHMSVRHGIEACLRAGLDVSIGDFVFEFDTLEISFGKELLWKVYQEALKGNDVVSVEPQQRDFTRKVFYKVFNRYSNANYDINASAFRLVSRRAINRVLELNMSSVFGQAVYASCGLKNSRIAYEGLASPRKARGLNLAIDSFLLYTDISKKICSFSIEFLLTLLVTGIAGVCVGNIDWLFKISLLLTMVLLLGDMTLLLYYSRLSLKGKSTKYLISSIEKIQKG